MSLSTPQYIQLGGLVLAGGTVAGAMLQWFVQLMAQWRAGMGKLRPRLDVHSPGVREAIAIMAPATLSSGMTQINIYVWREWSLPILGLIGASGVAGLACWATNWGCQYILGTDTNSLNACYRYFSCSPQDIGGLAGDESEEVYV